MFIFLYAILTVVLGVTATLTHRVRTVVSIENSPVQFLDGRKAMNPLFHDYRVLFLR